jgi:hypothetical protein
MYSLQKIVIREFTFFFHLVKVINKRAVRMASPYYNQVPLVIFIAITFLFFQAAN